MCFCYSTIVFLFWSTCFCTGFMIFGGFQSVAFMCVRKTKTSFCGQWYVFVYQQSAWSVRSVWKTRWFSLTWTWRLPEAERFVFRNRSKWKRESEFYVNEEQGIGYRTWMTVILLIIFVSCVRRLCDRQVSRIQGNVFQTPSCPWSQ